jgi:hypothetical protein
MGSKARRKKERELRKQRQRRDRQLRQKREIERSIERSADPFGRHHQRLLRQIPKAWIGETCEDVAVFDDVVLESLPSEMAAQVWAVRRAFEAAIDSRADDALQETAIIPRSSSLSEWRLFIRGLVHWLASETQAASEVWRRLDPERRPGRVATVMMTALRPDLEQISLVPGPADRQVECETTGNRLDDQLLYHAKLLHRTRFDRPALRFAQSGLNIAEESKDFKLGPKKIRWLRQFVEKHSLDEPELAAALSQAALSRAMAQPYVDLFDDAARAFKGPRHDRNNLLLRFFYYMRFDDAAMHGKSERALEKYLNDDLPKNKELTEPLRAAIASQIHLNEARELMQPNELRLMASFFGEREDSDAIRKELKAAVQAYPANREAYLEHSKWIESKLDDDRMTKAGREPLERELRRVMESWSKGLPDDAKPRLWLVDFLLENEHTEDAKPHVDWLAASRQDDPRVRAAPWKWQLLEAMRLCRRKAWLAEVPARLEEAEKLWPVWLSRDWLPYLKAGWLLRSGQSEALEQARHRICEDSGSTRDSLADACMMLGAAQRMQVPADGLKLLREPVEKALRDLKQVPLDELLSAASFFWDLHRTQLVYPAYRMHGGKIGKELLGRLKYDPQQALDRANDGKLHAAMLWCSEYRFWGDGYNPSLPPWFSLPDIERHPMFSAAMLNAFLRMRYQWRADKYAYLGPLVRKAAATQRDAYYRFWFNSLVDELDEVLARNSSRASGLNFDLFNRAFGQDNEDEDEDEFDEDDEFDDEDEFDEDLTFDPDCNCPKCQAAKRAFNARN